MVANATFLTRLWHERETLILYVALDSTSCDKFIRGDVINSEMDLVTRQHNANTYYILRHINSHIYSAFSHASVGCRRKDASRYANAKDDRHLNISYVCSSQSCNPVT
ncbi:hypothetical protein BsWGS_16660 [Bradybaena similaris]